MLQYPKNWKSLFPVTAKIELRNLKAVVCCNVLQFSVFLLTENFLIVSLFRFKLLTRKLLSERKLLQMFSRVSYFQEKSFNVVSVRRNEYFYKINLQKLHKRTEETSGPQRL